MEKLEGYVEHIIFQNQENGYTVLNVISGEEEIVCVGIFSGINEGEQIEAFGQYATHPSYGEQFRMKSFQVKKPEDAESVERYLGSGAIKGVGTALAARIVRRFQKDTFRIIEEEPERLAEVKGISERMAREIAQQVYEKREVRSAMMFLQQYGISNALSVKIYQQYGKKLYSILEENPYQIADDIAGVGFRTADEIAGKAGIHADSEFRVKSAMLYVLSQASLDGHVFLPQQELVTKTRSLLEIEIEDKVMQQYLLDLSVDRKIVVKKERSEEDTGEKTGTESESGEIQGITRIYTAMAYRIEMETAKMLCDLNVTGAIEEKIILDKIGRIEKKTGTCLDVMQKKAVMEAVRCGLLVLTGGPGTGKTTTINTLIAYFESEGLEILLAAPTGRAAKRMTEATGWEAKTIHRMLEISGDSEANQGRFLRNHGNPLEADVIIIDEMSMVDLYLMHALLAAVTVGTRLIMVGDVDQLPSVGPGSILKDIIASNCIPVVCLTHIFRQASESDIVMNAHKINHGEQVILDNKSKDFFFLKRQDANVIISVVIQLVRDKLPNYVEASSYDIQILTPMRKGLLGVERLNKILQEYLNPPSKEKQEHEYAGLLFREGDKVMQIKNNYQLEWEVRGKYGIPVEKGSGIFNGDMGRIREINLSAQRVTVEYDEHRMAEYTFGELEQLELAYAVTIHKSQGSEYPAVVIPLLQGPKMLMNRNLLYTAVTRARKCVTLVGDSAAFSQMIENETQQKRYTSLAERIYEMHCL